jgi:hypothetical protein
VPRGPQSDDIDTQPYRGRSRRAGHRRPAPRPAPRQPYDRALHHLARFHAHTDAIRRHLDLFRDSMMPEEGAAAQGRGELARHAAAMEHELAEARRFSRDAATAGLISMVEEAFAERRRVQRAMLAVLAPRR